MGECRESWKVGCEPYERTGRVGVHGKREEKKSSKGGEAERGGDSPLARRMEERRWRRSRHLQADAQDDVTGRTSALRHPFIVRRHNPTRAPRVPRSSPLCAPANHPYTLIPHLNPTLSPPEPPLIPSVIRRWHSDAALPSHRQTAGMRCENCGDEKWKRWTDEQRQRPEGALPLDARRILTKSPMVRDCREASRDWGGDRGAFSPLIFVS